MANTSDKENEEREIVNQKKLAYLMSLSQRHVQRLQTEGIIHRDREAGGYDVRECFKAFLDYKLESETNRKSDISKEAVQAEHEKVKMDISKLKLRRLRRELHEASDVEACWTEMLTNFHNKLHNLPTKIAMAISGEDMNKQIQIIQDLLNDAEKELAAYDPDDIDHSFGASFDDDDEDEDDEDED